MSQRRKILRIHATFFPSIFGHHPSRLIEIARDPLPPDTRVVDVRKGQDFRTLEFLLESDEFPEVPDGNYYPEITPMFRATDVPDRARLDAFLAAEHQRDLAERTLALGVNDAPPC